MKRDMSERYLHNKKREAARTSRKAYQKKGITGGHRLGKSEDRYSRVPSPPIAIAKSICGCHVMGTLSVGVGATEVSYEPSCGSEERCKLATGAGASVVTEGNVGVSCWAAGST